MISPHTKFDISMFPQCEDMKGTAKCRNLVGLGVRGHPKSTVMPSFDEAHMTSYLTLTHTPTPPAFGAPIVGHPIHISWRSLAPEDYSPWASMRHCLHDPTFSHFDTILACDGQMDGHTMIVNTALA